MITPYETDGLKPHNESAAGETIKELAERHMHDPNHHTTDEEIKNALVEFTPLQESNLDEIIEQKNDPDKDY